MKNLRVLLISNVRPSRTWNFARRIVKEVPGAGICGIAQRSMRSIPWIQQMIAAGNMRAIPENSGWRPKVWLLIRSMLGGIADWLLWFVHGCPRRLNHSRFTMEKLSQECCESGWPLAVIIEDAKRSPEPNLCDSPLDLVIFLGQFPSLPETSTRPSIGYLRACNHGPSENESRLRGAALISIEYFRPGTRVPLTICSLPVPWQPFDGPFGFTLKTDLITDDLLLQTAGSLMADDPMTASTLVSQWANRILAPSLSQIGGTDCRNSQDGYGRKRCRSTWKLCLDTALLVLPGVILRNWSRRVSRRYPLHILALHLISDRPHRMAVSTETFWRQVLFLKKHYRVVSLSEGVELLHAGQISAPTIVLTFDDGYSDNFLGLRAVANEVGISSTLFITTEPVEAHQEFNHDLMTGMTGFLPLTWDQIQYWSARGVEFGSHTRTHFDCSSDDLEHLQAELLGSKADLEAHLKKPVHFFAFPYGQQRNISSEAAHLASSIYAHYVSSFGGESVPKPGEIQSHLFRKKFYENRWELALELQSVFDSVDAIKRWFLGRSSAFYGVSSKAPADSPSPSPVRAINAQPTRTGIYPQAKNP